MLVHLKVGKNRGPMIGEELCRLGVGVGDVAIGVGDGDNILSGRGPIDVGAYRCAEGGVQAIVWLPV